jgi:hypothetical protein
MSAKNASPVISRERNAPWRSNAAKASGEVVRQKRVSGPSTWIPMNGYRNEKAAAILRLGRSVWMRPTSVSDASSSEAQTCQSMRSANLTSARRLRSFFVRPVVRYWARRRRRLRALPT